MPSMAISARERCADDCMDAAVRRPEGRTIHGAIVKNRSVHEAHEDSSAELPTVGATRPGPQSRGKCIFKDFIQLNSVCSHY
jgi:hypothetical protein